MTRWSSIDLTAKLLDAQKEDNADQWEVVEFLLSFLKPTILCEAMSSGKYLN